MNKSMISAVEKRQAAERLYDMLSQVREDYILSAVGISIEAVATEITTNAKTKNTTDHSYHQKQKEESGRGWPLWSGVLVTVASILILAGIFWWILSSRTVDVNSMFSEEYYRISVSQEYENITYIERIKPISEIPAEQLYSARDVGRIMNELMDASGEIRESKVDEQTSSFEEYKNGFPTGKAASITLESGYIQYIVLRNGKLSGSNDPADFIDKKEAYEKGIASIKEKYADKNIELREIYDENAITVYYNPHTESLYYQFDVTGALDGKWEDELSIFTFTPTINVNDINDIEIASSLGY